MSPPLEVNELDGEPADPDCLHCYLGSVIDSWSEAHPTKGLDAMILEVAEVLGEMAASEAMDCDNRQYVRSMTELVAHVLRYANEMRMRIAEKVAKDKADQERKSRAH